MRLRPHERIVAPERPDAGVAPAAAVRREAELAGATFVDEEVVGDGRIVTAQTWQSHPYFYREIFARLRDPGDAARS